MRAATPFTVLRRLAADRRGNVLMICGFAIIPVLAATGAGIDYARAGRLQTQLNAAADAASLAAVAQPMLRKPDANARSVAAAMFAAQSSNLSGLVIDPSSVNITISSTPGAVSGRIATVSYAAQSQNAFGGILGMPTVPIAGRATAKATIAPDVDFYLMIDTSPSMAFPATTAGVTTMVNGTGGCAFACHQTSRDQDTVWLNGQKSDYYGFARANNVELRTDVVALAIQNLTDTATSIATQNGAAYRMALSTFNAAYANLVAAPTAMTTVKAAATPTALAPMMYCKNSTVDCTQPSAGDNDTGTNFTAAFAGSLGTMPTVSGNGSQTPGDTPQSMLFLITDGMRDEQTGSSYGSGRVMGPIPTAQCTAIKNRGIKIAILYTEYLPTAASDSWSISNVRNPFLSPTDNISPALTNCASPGLFYKVSVDSDVSAALNTLFRQAIATPRLTQ